MGPLQLDITGALQVCSMGPLGICSAGALQLDITGGATLMLHVGAVAGAPGEADAPVMSVGADGGAVGAPAVLADTFVPHDWQVDWPRKISRAPQCPQVGTSAPENSVTLDLSARRAPKGRARRLPV
jgi:hypothetical protein